MKEENKTKHDLFQIPNDGVELELELELGAKKGGRGGGSGYS